ncbi:hypothetical protein LTR66_008075 [Elasticomyces elasticus]|nr:hypothetical protein LTR66_008075 [Elasticomyces elasticus]KAK5010864.1 hypothetical protein LTR28_007289 [Elasticomyces elasticus]
MRSFPETPKSHVSKHSYSSVNAVKHDSILTAAATARPIQASNSSRAFNGPSSPPSAYSPSSSSESPSPTPSGRFARVTAVTSASPSFNSLTTESGPDQTPPSTRGRVGQRRRSRRNVPRLNYTEPDDDDLDIERAAARSLNMQRRNLTERAYLTPTRRAEIWPYQHRLTLAEIFALYSHSQRNPRARHREAEYAFQEDGRPYREYDDIEHWPRMQLSPDSHVPPQATQKCVDRAVRAYRAAREHRRAVSVARRCRQVERQAQRAGRSATPMERLAPLETQTMPPGAATTPPTANKTARVDLTTNDDEVEKTTAAVRRTPHGQNATTAAATVAVVPAPQQVVAARTVSIAKAFTAEERAEGLRALSALARLFSSP